MADRRRTLFRRLISGDPSATSDAAAFLQSKLAESEKIVGHLMSKGGKSLAGLIGRFDATEAQRILDAEYSATLSAFDNYLARRKDGGARELLPSAGFAKIWLANSAPTKLVDGSWLQHCLASSTPPALSRFHAALFSIFADELGEGVLKQNHVTAFLDTLESAGVRLPRIDSPAFSSSPHLLSSAFDCALVQLSLSLFPESKLPEIIGYNLGYEQLPVHLLVSVHELEELGIDSTYFALHVSIDNHSSGHAKLAASCAWEYLEYVRAEFGEQEWVVCLAFGSL